jgi:hypothetical protein
MPGFIARAALALTLVAVACTRFATVGTDTVGPGYATGGGEWGTGGGITIAVRAFERGGVTVVCGAWATDRQSALTIALNENVIETGSVYLGAVRVVQNLAFMAPARYAQNLSGAQANCVASGEPWQPAFAAAEPRVRIPSLSFPIDSDSGQRVNFRETARPGAAR